VHANDLTLTPSLSLEGRGATHWRTSRQWHSALGSVPTVAPSSVAVRATDPTVPLAGTRNIPGVWGLAPNDTGTVHFSEKSPFSFLTVPCGRIMGRLTGEAPVDEAVLYARLMDLADALGLEVRTAAVAPPGGTCRIRDRLVVMLSRDATLDEKVDVLAEALAGHPDLDGMFILPQVRERLDRARPT